MLSEWKLIASRLSIMIIVTGGTLGANSSRGAETLALKFKPESTSRVQVEQKTEQLLTIGEGNVESKSTSFSVLKHTIGKPAADGSLEIVDQHEVLQTSLDIAGTTYDFDSANPDVEPGEPGLRPVAQVLRATFRTPVTTVIDAQGKIKEVRIPEEARADLDPLFASSFDPAKRKAAAEQQLRFLPDKPVNVGDKWKSNVDADFGGGQTMSFEMEYEYTGVVDEQGVKLHRIVAKPLTVAYTMDPNSPSPLKVIASDLTIKNAEGEYLFDAARGVVVRGTSKTSVAGTMKFSINGQELPGKVDLKLDSKTTLQP